LFARRQNPDGACRSMLAASALALGRDDLAQARTQAMAASNMADAAGLTLPQILASWQLGKLASVDGNLDDALVYFGRAAAAASREGDPTLTEFVVEAERLARRLQQLHHEREQHRQALLTLEDTVEEATMRLRDQLNTVRNPRALVGYYGWPRTSLPFKLPPHTPASPEATASSRMRQILASRGEAAGRAGDTGSRAGLGAAQADLPTWSSPEEPGCPASALGMAASAPISAAPLTITVHLLGPLRVALKQLPVTDWPSGRGRSLVKYLLTHRDPWPPRDVLMEVFWPSSAPKAARNSLNVAVHGLRGALRAATQVPVIVFDGGTYRLHSDVRLWLDVDEFERHVGSGRKLEQSGELAGAMVEYELAAALYQGDFLADDPYEEWPVLARERLRLAWLHTLDRLSHLYFGHERYASCATLCQRIIERDPCREDVQRRLMRCYSRQEQPHLALRQYWACAEALHAELDVDPATATTELHQQIRHHEPV